MEYKELVKQHTYLITDLNHNKWEVVETSDLEEICEAYHQSKLKNKPMKQIFLNFLEENGVIEKFAEQVQATTFNSLIKGAPPEKWIVRAFFFAKTPEGAAYWLTLDEKWQEIIKK